MQFQEKFSFQLGRLRYYTQNGIHHHFNLYSHSVIHNFYPFRSFSEITLQSIFFIIIALVSCPYHICMTSCLRNRQTNQRHTRGERMSEWLVWRKRSSITVTRAIIYLTLSGIPFTRNNFHLKINKCMPRPLNESTNCCQKLFSLCVLLCFSVVVFKLLNLYFILYSREKIYFLFDLTVSRLSHKV